MALYSIAGLTISVNDTGEYFNERMTEYMLPLVKEGEHCCDYRVNIQKLDKLPPVEGNQEAIVKGGLWRIAQNYPKAIYRDLIGMPGEVSVILQFGEKCADVSIFLPDKNPKDSRDFECTGRAFEELALHHQRMVLHSSCIEVNGKAILFSAPSGTGKSTHTGLWTTYVQGTRYINDDTPVLRLDREDAVYACGSPWSGKTTLNANVQAPLAAIVLLRRGGVNQIAPVKGAEAFARILGETRKFPFRDSMEHAAELCEQLISRVPVYDLACNISQDAVNVVRNELGI